MVRGWLLGGAIWGIHLGTPCSSFSRARRGTPPPLRDALRIMGLDGLSIKDQERVKIGNALMTFSFGVLMLCHRLLIPATLENPATSMIWLMRAAQHVA